MAGQLLRLFTEDIETALKKMGYENAGILFTALVCKNNGHEIPDIPDDISLVWDIILDQISRSDEYLHTKREAGKAGGLAKASTAKQRLASLAESTSYPILSSPIKEKKKNTYVPDPEFDQFWQAYPKKIKKIPAQKAWTAAKKKGLPEITELMGMIKTRAMTEDWTKDGGQYVPAPDKFLKEERWLDEIQKPPEKQSQPIAKYAGRVRNEN